VSGLVIEEFCFEAVGNAGFDKFLVDAALVVRVEKRHRAIASILEGWPENFSEVIVQGPTGTRQFHGVIAVAILHMQESQVPPGGPIAKFTLFKEHHVVPLCRKEIRGCYTYDSAAYDHHTGFVEVHLVCPNSSFRAALCEYCRVIGLADELRHY
jgi:hypothetical protein